MLVVLVPAVLALVLPMATLDLDGEGEPRRLTLWRLFGVLPDTDRATALSLAAVLTMIGLLVLVLLALGAVGLLAFVTTFAVPLRLESVSRRW
jgi:hypothetical protein